MKRLYGVITVVLLIAALLMPLFNSRAVGSGGISSYTTIPGVTAEEISAVETLIREYGSFKYGHIVETEAFLLPDGSFAGFTIELCKLLSGLFGAEFLPVYCGEWADMKEALDTNAIDFSGGFSRTGERTESYYMTVPIAGRVLHFYMLENSNVTSENELNGKRIGTLKSTFFLDAIRTYYPDYTFEHVEFSSYEEGSALLKSGDIDAIIATSAADPHFARKDTITTRDFFKLAYYPVSITASSASLSPILSVIDKYIESGGYETIISLYRECEFEYRQSNLFDSFTDEEIEYVEKMVSGGLKVNIGLQHDAYPASFYNNAEKEYQGVSIDILHEITRYTGLKFEPLSTSETTTLATILEKLKLG